MVKEGGFFGEVALLRGISRTASVRVSSSVCDTVALSASNLEAVLREYPEAYQSVSLEAEKRYQLTEQRRRQDERKSTGSKMSLSKLTNIRSFFTKSRSGSRDNTLERKKKKDIVEDDVKAKEKNDERVSSVGHDDSLTERGKIGKMLTSIKKSLKVRRESKVGGGRLSSVSTFGGTPSPSIRAIARITHVLELMEDDLAIVFAFIDPLTRAKLRLVCRKWNRQLANQRHWVLNDFSSVYKQTTPKVIKVVSAFISEQLALVNLCSCFQLYDDDILTLVSNCTNIASLGLSNCWKLTDRGLSYAAQYLPQLQALDISYCGQMTDRR
ncbi:hypothetical protein BJ742DRAFT_248773 [Cladochytrium replicatum]|nr:hypothetical protein BJ742DRAFT_248773 [Cladochytrium replicatum]